MCLISRICECCGLTSSYLFIVIEFFQREIHSSRLTIEILSISILIYLNDYEYF